MATMTALQAETRFGELLDRVMRGEEVVITRNEKAVARLVPEGESHRGRVQKAVAELRSARALMAQRSGSTPLTDKDIRDSIEEGRP